MTANIVIEGRVVGQRRPLFKDWELPIDYVSEQNAPPMTLRVLIQRIVLGGGPGLSGAPGAEEHDPGADPGRHPARTDEGQSKLRRTRGSQAGGC